MLDGVAHFRTSLSATTMLYIHEILNSVELVKGLNMT